MKELVNRIFSDLKVEFDAGVCSGIFKRGKRPGDNARKRRERRSMTTPGTTGRDPDH